MIKIKKYQKKIKTFFQEHINLKNNYLLALIVISISFLVLYSSYALFIVSKTKSGVYNITAGTINVELSSDALDANKQITINAGDTEEFEVTFTNQSLVAAKIILYYKMINPITLPNGADIGYKSGTTIPNSTGFILSKKDVAGDSISYTIAIKNNSLENITIEIGAQVGLSTPTLTLDNDEYLISQAISFDEGNTTVEGTSSDWEVSTTTNDSGGYTLLKFIGDIENSDNVTVSTNYYTDANISQMYFAFKGIASTSEMSNTNAYNVNIPNTVDGKTITELGPALFSGVDFANSDLENGNLVYFDTNLRIKEVNIPEGIKVIYDTTNDSVLGSFVYEINLSKITLPSTLTYIGNYSFAVTSLTEIKIPKSVITIGNYAFGHYVNFESITFEGATDGTSHLTTIGDDAFEALGDKITGTSYSVTIPSTTTTIGDYAFNNCNINTLTFAETSHITNIGDHAFDNNDITILTIPASVTNIESFAFYGNSLTSLTLAGTSTSGLGIDSSSLTTIGYSAFDVDNVNSIIYLPSTLTTIDGYSFSCDYRDSLCTIYVNNTAIPSTFNSDWAGNYARKYVLNGSGSYTCVENCP